MEAAIGMSLRSILTSSTCVTVQSCHGLGLAPCSVSFRAALSKHLQKVKDTKYK